MIKKNPVKIGDILANMDPAIIILFCLCFCTVKTYATEFSDDMVISTDKFKVRGNRYQLPFPGKTGYSFLGIPFAKPPLGELRFKHPQPLNPWNGIYNATNLQNSCFQMLDTFFGDFKGSNMWNPATQMSEDCLYLNVWVSTTTLHEGNAAVLVWIHGGGFFGGSPNLDIYDGKYLAAQHDVVVVSISYRTGSLGFFNLGDPIAPGNAGMFDQVMALDWIQRNIRSFGGNPHNITLFGGGAGAVSVSLHLLSPLSRNKFQRAIMQSGTANMPWSTVTSREAIRRSKELATDILRCGYSGSDDLEYIVKCMTYIPVEKLVDGQWLTRGIMQYSFLPAIDGVFLPDDPIKLLNQGHFKKCPILLGSNLNEGFSSLVYELPELLQLRRTTMNSDQFRDSMNNLFYYYPQFPQINNEFGRDAINYQYSNPTNMEDQDWNLKALDNAVGDFHFICNVNYFQKHYAAAGQDVFTYLFTQQTKSSPWPEWMGVNHRDEIQYIFGEPYKPFVNYTENEKELSTAVMKYWTNFAKTGNPNIAPSSPLMSEWPIYTENGKEYLELNAKSAVKSALRAKECTFWKQYLPKLVRNTDELLRPPPTRAPCPNGPLPEKTIGSSGYKTDS